MTIINEFTSFYNNGLGFPPLKLNINNTNFLKSLRTTNLCNQEKGTVQLMYKLNVP